MTDIPVFTRKLATDVSYLACAQRLLAAPDAFYPQFATHNAHTLAAVLDLAGERRDFEFQRLHGMGEALYEQVVGKDKLDRPCRVYAPVGSHEDLLAYLVRRLLENGANTSFVNRLVDERAPIAEIVADPVTASRGAAEQAASAHRRCRAISTAPSGAMRAASTSPIRVGWPSWRKRSPTRSSRWHAAPIIGGSERAAAVRAGARSRRPPARARHRRRRATASIVDAALARAAAPRPRWDRVDAGGSAPPISSAPPTLHRGAAARA